MSETQPITLATIKVQDNAFWNWLADESQMNLWELSLVGANELPNGDIEFVVKRKEKKPSQIDVAKLFQERLDRDNA